MRNILLLVASALSLTWAIPAGLDLRLHPSDNSGPSNELPKRDIPARPASSGPMSFHQDQFNFLETTGYGPAVDGMPVFLYATTDSGFWPCYPESGVQLGSDPPEINPGTDTPLGANPGQDCTGPGVGSNQAYTLANPFPVYVEALYCAGTNQWRVNYDLYYVHDGVISAGHKHDWEGITVVWGQDEAAEWFHRIGAFYHEHGHHNYYSWDQLMTVNVDNVDDPAASHVNGESPGSVPGGDNDVADENTGQMKRHPKVFVGFFSHSAFKDVDTSRATDFHCDESTLAGCAGDLMHEYRAADWWRLPRIEDVHSGQEIHQDWNYGDADSTPYHNKWEMCSWA